MKLTPARRIYRHLSPRYQDLARRIYERRPKPPTYDVMKSALDRPGTRRILGVAASARHWKRRREWVPVRWTRGGFWMHAYPDAVVPLPDPDPEHYRLKEAIARDAYFHRYEPRPGDVVVHVGAGAGWEANLLSRLVRPTGHVYLIEAHPKTYVWLIRRIRVSRLSNVTPIQTAISDAPGVVRMSDVEDHMHNHVGEPGGIEVGAATLSQVFAEHGIERVDLLTMNIEGAEREAIRGLGPAAAQVRRIAVSCHDFQAERGGADWTRTKVDVRTMLEGYGYTVFPRDPADTRDWVNDYLYAERSPVQGSQEPVLAEPQ